MNKAKSYKLKLCILFFVASLIASVFMFTLKTNIADAAISVTSPTSYFTGSAAVAFEDDKVVASVTSDDTVAFKNRLAINNAEFELSIPENLDELKIKLTSDSYFKNGALKIEAGKLDTSIDNVILISKEKLSLNGKEVTSGNDVLSQGNLKVSLKVTDNVLSVSVGSLTVTNSDEYYKIGGKDKVAAKVEFGFTVSGDSAVKFGIVSVDQNVGVDGYKQSFELESGKVATIAKPRVSVNDSFLTSGGNVVKGKMYNLTFSAYSVFGNYTNSSFYLKVSEDDAEKVWLQNSASPKSVSFNEDVTFTVTNGEVDAETYSVVVKDKSSDELAPEYSASEYALDSYKEAVIKAATADYDLDGIKSVRLGDSVEVPSMENLVSDDLTSYEDLKKTVYYKTPSSSLTTSSDMKITLTEAGDYEFFVIFTDLNGNAIDKDDFYTVDETDENNIIPGAYYDYVFTFHIEDDAPILVTPNSKKQADGYLNTVYTATDFTVKASGNTTTYTLYYNKTLNATENSDGWIEIPDTSFIGEDYNENGFTYNDLVSLDYDGYLTFTPVKLGTYKIECTVTSDNSVRSSSAAELIVVNTEPTVVEVPSHWLRDNVWSVVFLSIGTLCLIGIIVLLFIKPEQETEKDETGEALKTAKK